MAGTPADMTVEPYKDYNNEHNHTYYGRGCSNGWGTGGDGGSQTPCVDSDAGGRFVLTNDNETQKNGTYYNVQATTAGSGAGIAVDNTNAPDTFCPLGWQLPYSGTGGNYYDKTRSWRYLFTTYNMGYEPGTAEDVAKTKTYPFSYVYSGYFNWYTGRLYSQRYDGRWWSSTVLDGNTSYYLYIGSPRLRPFNTSGKADGRALRCVNIFSIPSSTARWQTQLFQHNQKMSQMIIPITAMAVLMLGIPAGPINLVRIVSQILMIVRPRKSELTTPSKLLLQVLALVYLPTTLLLLILSVLLVGKCLTMARVGLIMISLDHGSIYSNNTIMAIAEMVLKLPDLTHSPMYSPAISCSDMAHYSTKDQVVFSGHQPFILARVHIVLLSGVVIYNYTGSTQS